MAESVVLPIEKFGEESGTQEYCMCSDYLLYWRPKTVDFYRRRGDGPLDYAASNQLQRRHVSVGDTIWVVTVRAGSLRLIGRVRVGRVTDRAGAIALLKNDDVWKAEHYVIAEEGTAGPRRDFPIDQLAQSLRFESSAGHDRLIVKDGKVNPKQLQTMRTLTSQSALLLQGNTGAACLKVQ